MNLLGVLIGTLIVLALSFIFDLEDIDKLEKKIRKAFAYAAKRR